MSFPYLPIVVSEGMAFQHVETGETLAFDSSWFGHLDDVERILMQNHHGDYDVIWP